MTDKKKIVVSGIQPTGELHLGNYLGAIKNWVELQDDYECYFFIADYHSITIPYEPSEKEKQTLDLAKDLVALGLTRSKLFVQSQIPEVTELSWYFNCITPIGELERMTQYKDKSSQHKDNVNSGLFTYPVLQAADILIYKGELVPVGEDQVQHVELTRDIAKKFNKRFGKTFPETKPYLTKSARLKSLQDPTKKMSKSLGPKHYAGIFEDEDAIRDKFKKAVTTPEGIENLKMLTELLSERRHVRYPPVFPAGSGALLDIRGRLAARSDRYCTIRLLLRSGCRIYLDQHPGPGYPGRRDQSLLHGGGG